MAPKTWISIPNIKIYLETKFLPNRRIFVFWWPFCTLVTMATAAILNFFNPPKSCHTLRWIFLQSLMKGIQNHGNCGKVYPTDSDFFGLSRSTRCGCCSYQVSSISVRRVTCYDHFCVFQFFTILVVSRTMAAILKLKKKVCTSTHSV